MSRVNFGKKAVLAAIILVAHLAAGASAPIECGRTIIPISEQELADWHDVVTLFRHDAHRGEDIRYAFSGAKEISTPLDKIAQDLSALCDLIEYTILQQNDGEKERRMQKSIKCLKPWDCEILTGHVIVEVLRKHRDTLKGYHQQNEHRAVISTLLGRVIGDLSIIDILLAAQ